MTQITYHILRNESINTRLQKDLDDAFPDPTAFITMQKLETLPQLICIIQLCCSDKFRQPLFKKVYVSLRAYPAGFHKIIRSGGMVYDKHHLPAGRDLNRSYLLF